MLWQTVRAYRGRNPSPPRGQRRGALAVVVLAALVLGPIFSGCSTTDVRLGDVPQPTLLTPANDASADASDAGPTPMCVATECPAGLTTCPSDFGPTYKCSVDLRRDRDHCGACGHECITMEPLHMTSRCIDGGCALECLSPPRYVPAVNEFVATSYQNCNGILDDGCEVDVFSSAEHCGACGNACPGGTACVDGQCGCPDGLDYCSGFCLDLSENDDNCGACGTVCQSPDAPCQQMPANTGYGCMAGACEKLKCMFGFADCDADLGLVCASNGCETSMSDATSCGACGNACKPDEECRFGNSGYECTPTCDKVGLTACEGGFCADTQNDPNHCGGCLLPCPPAGPHQQSSCKKGLCEVVCAEGFADCNGDPTDGCEIDLRVHPQHCGACGVSCDLALGQPCVEGKCLVAPCEGTETR